MRLAVRVVAAALALLACMPGHLIARATRCRRNPWVRRFLALAGDAFGLDVEVVGTPLSRDVLYVANHVSWLDILALGGAVDPAFVSKDEVAGWPLVGWLAKQGGTIFICRETRGAVRGQAETLAEALASGRPAALFPEGTTGDGHTVLPFRASLFAALERGAGAVRVQPVAIDYGAWRDEVAWPDEEPTGVNAKRVLSRKGRIAVRLIFLPPVALDGGRKAVAAEAQTAVAAVLMQR